MALIREGRRGAFEAVYDRHHRGILSFCRHMLGDPQEAEDAVQHTFLAAYNDLTSSHKQIHLRAWLFTIARNRCYSMLRARREQPAAEIDEAMTEGLATQVQRRQDLRDLVLDMRRLPEEQRAALVLAELESLSHEQIGETLGVPREKVKALVFQARESLVASRAARETDCAEIREQLATQRGGGLRRANLRRHLRECAGCRDFKKQIERQRRQLAILLPVAPTIALKEGVLGATIGGGASVGIAGGSLVLSSALKSGLAKVVVGAVLAGVGTAGTIVVTNDLKLPFASQGPPPGTRSLGDRSQEVHGTAAMPGPSQPVATLPSRTAPTTRPTGDAATGTEAIAGIRALRGPTTGGVSFVPPGSAWLASILRGATALLGRQIPAAGGQPTGAAAITAGQPLSGAAGGRSGSGQHQGAVITPWDVLGGGIGITVGQRSSVRGHSGKDGGYGDSATGRSAPSGSTRGQGGGTGSYSPSSGSDGGAASGSSPGNAGSTGSGGGSSASGGSDGTGASSGSGSSSPSSTSGGSGGAGGSDSASGSTGTGSGSSGSSGATGSGGSGDSGGSGGDTGSSGGGSSGGGGSTGSGSSGDSGGAPLSPHGDADTPGGQTTTSTDSGSGSGGGSSIGSAGTSGAGATTAGTSTVASASASSGT